MGKCGVLRSVANGGEAKSLLAIGEIFEDELASRITGGSLQAVVYTDGTPGIGCPVALSVTFPLMVICACRLSAEARRKSEKNILCKVVWFIMCITSL